MNTTPKPEKIITVTAAIIEKDGLILAARRCDGGPLDGYFEFPGGKLEDGESPRECLKRELHEEFNVDCSIGPYVSESLHRYPEKTVRLMAYLAIHRDGDFELRDHSEILWLKRDELSTLQWAPADIPLVEDFLRMDAHILNKWYSENASDYIDETKNLSMEHEIQRFFSHLQAQFPQERRFHILDGGCGSGRDSLYFLSKDCDVTAIDASHEICRRAEETTGHQVRCLRFQNLDYVECFHGIWCCASLLHVKKTEMPKILKKLEKALVPGGILYMSFKAGENERFDSKGRFFNDYTADTMTTLLDSAQRKSGSRLHCIHIEENTTGLRGADQTWLNVFLKKGE